MIEREREVDKAAVDDELHRYTLELSDSEVHCLPCIQRGG